MDIRKNNLSGVLNVDKPPGITSHDAVSHIRRILNIKVGHTGTLDPFAVGVLLIAIGPATRLIEYSHDWNKEYATTIMLGATSDTDDVTGKISPAQISTSKKITQPTIQKALQQFIGEIKQIPPIYSAKKIKGERSYKLARQACLSGRQGSTHSMPPTNIVIHKIEITNYEYPHLSLNITCSTGTYIRSLARDIGQVLGTGAYVKQLTRTGIGSHIIAESVKLKDSNKESLSKHLLPTETLIEHLPFLILPEANVAQFYQGQKIGGRELTIQNNKTKQPLLSKKITRDLQQNPVAVYDVHSTLLGIGYYDPKTHLLHPKKTLDLSPHKQS